MINDGENGLYTLKDIKKSIVQLIADRDISAYEEIYAQYVCN